MFDKIKEFIEDFYNYTITISITESELFDHYSWLEDMSNWLFDEETLQDNNKMCEIYVKQIEKDMLYDLLYNQNAIKEQFINDLCAYGANSEEYKYIKEFYNEHKDMFNFEIDFKEYEV